MARTKAEARDIRAPRARPLGFSERDKGVALRLDCPELSALRDRLAEAWAMLLAAPDRGPAWLHATIANGLDPREVRAFTGRLAAGPLPPPFAIAALELWRWRPEGPLDLAGRIALRP